MFQQDPYQVPYHPKIGRLIDVETSYRLIRGAVHLLWVFSISYNQFYQLCHMSTSYSHVTLHVMAFETSNSAVPRLRLQLTFQNERVGTS